MSTSPVAQGAARLALAPAMAARLRTRLPAVAEQTVAAVVDEVPSYAHAFGGDMGETIEGAVRMALAGFVRLAEDTKDTDPRTPLQPALAAAYELGRGEARDGRSMDALLSAYRVGARVAWRELSAVVVDDGLPSGTVAQFAELVFAYIDELSAASAAGHADEQATTGRVRELYLERLGRLLFEDAAPEALDAAAERAGWRAPETLTAVVVPEAEVRPALAVLDAGTLRLPGDLVDAEELALLLVPDAAGARRTALVELLEGRDAVVGPSRPWAQAADSARRAARARTLLDAPTVDTEAHLPELLLASDADALADLRARVLAPLAELRPVARERLEQTLRSWLLHQGRRDDVAADLVVHPQTVRYRMTQVRELFGSRLQDPAVVLELVVALGTRRDGVA